VHLVETASSFFSPSDSCLLAKFVRANVINGATASDIKINCWSLSLFLFLAPFVCDNSPMCCCLCEILMKVGGANFLEFFFNLNFCSYQKTMKTTKLTCCEKKRNYNTCQEHLHPASVLKTFKMGWKLRNFARLRTVIAIKTLRFWKHKYFLKKTSGSTSIKYKSRVFALTH
jgi:hypothetical protein